MKKIFAVLLLVVATSALITTIMFATHAEMSIGNFLTILVQVLFYTSITALIALTATLAIVILLEE